MPQASNGYENIISTVCRDSFLNQFIKQNRKQKRKQSNNIANEENKENRKRTRTVRIILSFGMWKTYIDTVLVSVATGTCIDRKTDRHIDSSWSSFSINVILFFPWQSHEKKGYLVRVIFIRKADLRLVSLFNFRSS